jgi:hypothetical protein
MSSLDNEPRLIGKETMICAHCCEPILNNERFVSGKTIISRCGDLIPGIKLGFISYYHEDKTDCFIASGESK